MDGLVSELKQTLSSLQLVSKIVKLVVVFKGSHSYTHVVQPQRRYDNRAPGSTVEVLPRP